MYGYIIKKKKENLTWSIYRENEVKVRWLLSIW